MADDIRVDSKDVLNFKPKTDFDPKLINNGNQEVVSPEQVKIDPERLRAFLIKVRLGMLDAKGHYEVLAKDEYCKNQKMIGVPTELVNPDGSPKMITVTPAEALERLESELKDNFAALSAMESGIITAK